MNTFDVGEQALVLGEIVDEAFDGSSYLRFEQSAHGPCYFELPASSLG